MLRLVGSVLLALGACALGLAIFGRVPVHAGVGVSLMCSGIAWALYPWWAREVPAPAPIQIETPEPLQPRKSGGVAKFMAENLMRSDGRRVRVDELNRAYASWCEANDFSALGADEFQQRLIDLCEAAGIRRGKGRSIVNVALAE